MSNDETQKLVDSVMGNLKTLLQEMSDSAQSLHKQWVDRARELQNYRTGYGGQMYEETESEARAHAQKQRECDELYDRAKTIEECMNLVARRVNNIIGENIVIQFSKWNMR
jgi:hypothetical protein